MKKILQLVVMSLVANSVVFSMQIEKSNPVYKEEHYNYLRWAENDKGEIAPKIDANEYPNAWTFCNWNIYKSNLNKTRPHAESKKWENRKEAVFAAMERIICSGANGEAIPTIFNLQETKVDQYLDLVKFFAEKEKLKNYKIISLNNKYFKYLNELDNNELVELAKKTEDANIFNNTIIYDGDRWELDENYEFIALPKEKPEKGEDLTLLAVPLIDKVTNKKIVIFCTHFDILESIQMKSCEVAAEFINKQTEKGKIDYIFSGDLNTFKISWGKMVEERKSGFPIKEIDNDATGPKMYEYLINNLPNAFDWRWKQIIGAYAPKELKETTFMGFADDSGVNPWVNQEKRFDSNILDQIFYNGTKYSDVLMIWKDPNIINTDFSLIDRANENPDIIREALQKRQIASDHVACVMVMAN